MRVTKPNVVVEAPAEQQRRLYGHLVEINSQKAYCFVMSDNGKKYFLHANNIEGGFAAMKRDAGVYFTPFRVREPGKHDRAIDAVPTAQPIAQE